ncbi:MAG TPA: fatty acid desaturase [Bryobacteraceae bacterium]|nr:fatty acid desaturase [Bryobacteraceae bacterium]
MADDCCRHIQLGYHLRRRFLHVARVVVGTSALLLIVATRPHALLVLLHDASHFLLCRSNFWNELISDLFCGLPFGLTTQAYRTWHTMST